MKNNYWKIPKTGENNHFFNRFFVSYKTIPSVTSKAKRNQHGNTRYFHRKIYICHKSSCHCHRAEQESFSSCLLQWIFGSKNDQKLDWTEGGCLLTKSMIPRKFYSFVGNCGGQKSLNDIRPVTSPALATVDYSHLHSFHSGYQKMNFHSLFGAKSKFR